MQAMVAVSRSVCVWGGGRGGREGLSDNLNNGPAKETSLWGTRLLQSFGQGWKQAFTSHVPYIIYTVRLLKLLFYNIPFRLWLIQLQGI